MTKDQVMLVRSLNTGTIKVSQKSGDIVSRLTRADVEKVNPKRIGESNKEYRVRISGIFQKQDIVESNKVSALTAQAVADGYRLNSVKLVAKNGEIRISLIQRKSSLQAEIQRAKDKLAELEELAEIEKSISAEATTFPASPAETETKKPVESGVNNA